jgi:hypothetical protein
LDTIERAIDHPPAKPDHFGTAVSVLGAIVIVLRTLGAPSNDKGQDLMLVIAAAGLGGAQFVRYLTALFAKTPLKDGAKKHIQMLKIAQGWKPEDDPVSNWRRLRNLLWARIFHVLSLKK